MGKKKSKMGWRHKKDKNTKVGKGGGGGRVVGGKKRVSLITATSPKGEGGLRKEKTKASDTANERFRKNTLVEER